MFFLQQWVVGGEWSHTVCWCLRNNLKTFLNKESSLSDVRELLSKDKKYTLFCFQSPKYHAFLSQNLQRTLGLEDLLWYLLWVQISALFSEQCWANPLPFLCLSYLSCEMGMTISDKGCSRVLISEEGTMVSYPAEPSILSPAPKIALKVPQTHKV